MVSRLLASFVLLLTCIAAQTGPTTKPLQPVRLWQLGPLPEGVPQLTLHVDERLLDTHGNQVAPGAFAAAIPTAAKELVLHVDRNATAGPLAALLEAARTGGVTRVHFAATLPNGTPGGFVLALPNDEVPRAMLSLRLHHDRPGVPPASLTPLLARMHEGWRKIHREPFVFGVEVPTDASCEQLLQALSAIALADVHAVVVTSTPTAAVADVARAGLGALADTQPARDASLAMDLGPVPAIQVEGRALPPEKPAVRATQFGCLQRASSSDATERHGGAGGRFGKRGGGRVPADQAPAAEAIVASRPWALRQQQPDGSFPCANGQPDVEAASLVLLTLLGDGHTLDTGPHHEVVRRGVGWLLGRQRPDGAFVDPGPGSIAQHALAIYALAEAAGLSGNGAIVRGGVQAGLDWLFAQRQTDGGWHDGTPGAASDVTTTAKCLAAIASAEFFAFEVVAKPAELVGWFDTKPAQQPVGEAAALFTRFFCGQDPKQVPAMTAGATRLSETADPADPWGAYWTTYALFQMGGRPWQTWQKKVHQAIVQMQIKDGAFAGTWEPAPGQTRLVTSALRVLTLEAYYRYSRLVR